MDWRCEARREQTRDGHDVEDDARDCGLGAAVEMPNERPDELKADNDEKEDDAEDFAGSSLRQPALHPSENHARQQDIENCEEQKHRGGGKEKERRGAGDADGHAQQPQAAHCGGWVERAISDANEKIGTKGERESAADWRNPHFP